MIPLTLACAANAPEPSGPPSAPSAPAPLSAEGDAAARARMVESQLRARGVEDPAVLRAMGEVPRERFVPADLAALAYVDHPLPIGLEQTISQPYVVAVMTEVARVGPGKRVLEVGTGSGYQAAVLAALGAEVWSIEIVAPLSESAGRALEVAGYRGRVHLRVGDGYRGWPEAAPFDAIVVTAAPDHVPEPLREQLAPGGRLVIPVGGEEQWLRVLEKRSDGTWAEDTLFPVRFVPMTGEAGGAQ